MALEAGGIVTVLADDFPNGPGAADIGINGGDIVRRRSGRSAENVLQQPHAADHR
ncbi:hypothetical protein D3C83_239170 [compost metagenome]